ncbi:MAG: hypothetical protein ACK4G4_11750 [Thermus sp.]|uniref:hypothetical protein n=1 Tax=Thermus sp. TaxID=275 RepID=UPI00391BB493
MPRPRTLGLLALALLLGVLASCNTQGGGGSGGNTPLYRFSFDNEANSQAFGDMPDAVPIRGRLTLESGTTPPPTPPEVRLQYRFLAVDNALGPWQDGPTMRLVPDQGGFQAEATLEGIWPTGLDLQRMLQTESIQLRALLGNQVLATSSFYPFERINPLWVRVFGEPSIFVSLEVSDNLVCGVGRTRGQDPDPLAWCLNPEGQVVYEIRETGPAWGYLDVALAEDGTVYTLPNTGPIRAFKDGAFTGFSLSPRGNPTTLAVGDGALFVGGALPMTNGSCSVLRLYVDRYRLADLQQEASLVFDASQAQEDLSSQCETKNSAPAHLWLAGGRLYMVYAVRVGAYFNSDGDFVALNRMGMAALHGQTLAPVWLRPPEGSHRGSNTVGSVAGWFLYWGSPSTCTPAHECRALAYTVRGFDLDLNANWLWASIADKYLDPRDGSVRGDAEGYPYQILLENTPVYLSRFSYDRGGNRTVGVGVQMGTKWVWRYVPYGPAGDGAVEAVRRHQDQVYFVGQVGGKAFVARLR